MPRSPWCARNPLADKGAATPKDALGEKSPLQAAPGPLLAARALDRNLLRSDARASPRQDFAFPRRAVLVLGAERTGIPQVRPPTTSLWRCTAHGLPRRRRLEEGPTSSSVRVGDRRLKRSGLRRVRHGAAGAHAGARHVRRDPAARPRPLAQRPRLCRVLPLAVGAAGPRVSTRRWAGPGAYQAWFRQDAEKACSHK